MADRWVLDTNVIAGHAKGDKASTRLIEDRGDVELYASIITRVELFSPSDLPPDEAGHILQLLQQVTVVALNEDVEETTILIRRKTKLKLPDAVIAATAVVFNATLVTFDRRLASLDWPDLKIIIPV
jgi:predicted nucleic acid-binding protein